MMLAFIAPNNFTFADGLIMVSIVLLGEAHVRGHDWQPLTEPQHVLEAVQQVGVERPRARAEPARVRAVGA